MNTLTALTLLLIVALIACGAYPFVRDWWNTKRPVRCPACYAWKPIESVTFIRHNSGMHVRVCEECYRNLYAPFSNHKGEAK